MQPELVGRTFDYNHLKAIHKHLFQDLYEWAGTERYVNIRKADMGREGFEDFRNLRFSAAYTFECLQKDNYLRGLSILILALSRRITPCSVKLK